MRDKKAQMEQIARYNHLIQSQTGRAVRPYRADGYVNFLNKYGTKRDSSETYNFMPEPDVPDNLLCEYYEGNGLFAKIIDAPAEEAVKHGFELRDVTDDKINSFVEECLDELDWEEVCMRGIKWQRLFGGAIAVLLVNDGHGLEEPLDWDNIKSIDDIVVYDRSVVEPDYSSLYKYDPQTPFLTRGSRLGSPEYYYVFSKYGNFTVHESRVLEFKNGVLPENTPNVRYQLWGLPEYIRIHRAIRDAEVAHGTAPKLLDRSIQAVYKMKNLSEYLSTAEGEDMVLRRMQVIDMARGLLSSMVIDSEGEDYTFQTFTMNGVSDVIDTTCNFLSAITNIPQTILFGKQPLGLSSGDESAIETWYSYVERIQKRSIRSNLRYLLSILFRAGIRTGEIDEIPPIKIDFKPLKVLSESEQLDIDLKKAQIAQTKAATAQVYVDMQVLDPEEVRRALAESEEYEIDTILDDYSEEELLENDPSQKQQPMEGEEGGMPGFMPQPGIPEAKAPGTGEGSADTEGSAAPNAPSATKLPQDMTEEDLKQAEEANSEEPDKEDSETEIINPEKKEARLGGVGVIVVQDGKILCGTRHNDRSYGLLCGPGGSIEDGETAYDAAIRETKEEFGITPNSLISLGKGQIEPETNTYPEIFLCLDWEGDPHCDDLEMVNPRFLSLDEIEEYKNQMFHPFKMGLDTMLHRLYDGPEKINKKADSEEKTLDFRSVCDNVSLRDYILQFKKVNEDGAPEGNQNAAGPHKKKGSGSESAKKGRKISKAERKKIEKRIVGRTSSQGVAVKSISNHAFDRLGGRLMSVKRIEDMLDSEDIKPDKQYPDRKLYNIPGSRLVLSDAGEIVTVMWRKQNK